MYILVTYIVSHDAELMQRRLAVEENNITINQVTLNNVPILSNKIRREVPPIKKKIKYNCHHVHVHLYVYNTYPQLLGSLLSVTILQKSAPKQILFPIFHPLSFTLSLSLSLFLSHFLNVCPFCCMKFAPGCLSGPLITSFLRKSTLNFVTLSGYDSVMATSRGTITYMYIVHVIFKLEK